MVATLQAQGFSFVLGAQMRQLIQPHGDLSDWPRFAGSWNDLAPDTYLEAHGRYRRRRHAVFSAAATGAINREPARPHYQALRHNPLQGDIERWFEPVENAVANGASLMTILAFCRSFFGRLAPATAQWSVEVHQFRIEARADEAGEPTPEGMHRDGVDYVLVLLIERENIVSGTTTIHDTHGATLGTFTLCAPLDAALVDDARVLHGVTAVTPLDPAKPSHRDVLVVTFRTVIEEA